MSKSVLSWHTLAYFFWNMPHCKLININSIDIRGAQSRHLCSLEFCLSWVQPPQQLPISVNPATALLISYKSVITIELLPSLSSIIMPCQTYHSQVIHAYLLHMMIWDSISPEENVEELLQKLVLDMEILDGIWNTCYLQGCICVPKQENLSLAWEYAQNPADHQQFITCYVFLHKYFRLSCGSLKITLCFKIIQIIFRHLLKHSLLLHFIKWDVLVMVHHQQN